MGTVFLQSIYGDYPYGTDKLTGIKLLCYQRLYVDRNQHKGKNDYYMSPRHKPGEFDVNEMSPTSTEHFNLLLHYLFLFAATLELI